MMWGYRSTSLMPATHRLIVKAYISWTQPHSCHHQRGGEEEEEEAR